MNIGLDCLSVSNLAEQYKISRNELYKRMNALSVIPEKRNDDFYISPWQRRVLDELDVYLKSGGILSDLNRYRWSVDKR